MTTPAGKKEPPQQDEVPDLEADLGGPENNDGDTGGGQPQQRQERQEEDAPAAPVKRQSPSDAIRDQIAARFKEDRGASKEDIEFNGDMTDPANLYGKVAQTNPDDMLDPEPGAPEPGVPREQQQAQPTKFKIKVRGVEREVTAEELIATAQKVEAADSYLDEARKLVEDATKVNRERTPGQQHPAGESAQTDEDTDALDAAQHPGADTKAVIEKIQFGDVDEAAQELEKIIDARVAKKSGESSANALLTQRMRDDLARSQKGLKDFTDANKDLADDPVASAAMEKLVYEAYFDDIKSLGVSEDKIPTNPKQLADWHRFYRIEGYKVKDIPAVLNTAKEKFTAWRGTGQPKNQTAQRREGQPRVEVDRTQRRESIQTQPSRSAAPVAPGSGNSQPQGQRKVSDVVANMRKSRGQVVG